MESNPKNDVVSAEELAKINKLTRRVLTAEEVYTFSVTLCDNDIDRDKEAFSNEALENIAKLFIGKTGISDHKAKSENQKSRIFDAWVETDSQKKTADGREYRRVKARAYMPRVKSNLDLISEIDAGIKKEVSVGCAVGEKLCSVCGKSILEGCNHIRGQFYKTASGRVPCYTVLNSVTDAYEWSFVAVPAQKNAGVTKSFIPKEEKKLNLNEILEIIKDGGELALSKSEVSALKSHITELNQLSELGKTYLAEKRAVVIKDFTFPENLSADTKKAMVESLSAKQLSEVYTALKEASKKSAEVQLCPDSTGKDEQNGGFIIK